MAVSGLRANLGSLANHAGSQNLLRKKHLPRVHDAFQQQAVSGNLGPNGGWLKYRSANGSVRDTRIVRILEGDGNYRHISIREKVNKHGQITDVLAEDGIKKKLGRTDEPYLKNMAPKDRIGDHGHLAMDADATGMPGQRDTLGGLFGKLQDYGREEFQEELAYLNVQATEFGEDRGKARDVHVRPPRTDP